MNEAQQYANELYHYGVKGMKWGVIRDRARDRMTTNKLKRHVTASARNLKDSGRMASESKLRYDEASKAYTKELSTPRLSAKKKRARVEEAGNVLSATGKEHGKAMGNLQRAERIYKSDAKAYTEQVNRMIEKHGAERYSSIKTKNVEIGKMYTAEIIRTGINMANLPVIGTMYTGNYIGKRDYEDRMTNIRRESSKFY